MEEYLAIKKYIDTHNSLNKEHYRRVAKLYSATFNKRYSLPCTCNNKTIKSWWKTLKNHYENDFKS